MSGPVVIVGNGLIGSALRAALEAGRTPVVTVARRAARSSRHFRHDLATAAGRLALRADLERLRPHRVILAHGPSDVSWIERHEQGAAEVHCGVAEAVAATGLPTVFVSTDNVFEGSAGPRRPADPAVPGNAYGRVKLRAEQLLLATGTTLALRVSLVYGWAGPRHRATYAERCLAGAFSAAPERAPVDQVFTPVHIHDVTTVLAALCAGPMPTGVRHLAGPEELSRYTFARLAYRLAGADESLVRACPRAETEWASRPPHSSLVCDDFTDVAALVDWRPRGPAEGLRTMLAERSVVG
jgi:dTDP-4-dehydrorhamnose reductase